MKCKICPALGDNSGYEHSADDWWCELGEDMESGYSDECGCKRRSIKKIKEDIKIAREINDKAFASECGRMLDNGLIS